MAALLVIEDSITIRKLVELSFRGTGVEVDFASSGLEGLAKLKSAMPNVLLMDYVLPDMKGLEVCSRIASTEGRKPFVLVMSARIDEVRAQFAPFPFVTDFVGKPFKAPAIVELVLAALKRDGAAEARPAASPASQPSLPAVGEREAAAFALFAQLRAKLAQIPSWLPEMGDMPPAKFFAKRILTPDVVDRLIEAMTPILRDRLKRASPVAETVSSDALLEGRIGGLSPFDILALVQRLERTAELVIGEHGEIITFARDGKLVLATTRDAGEWMRDLELDLASVPAEALRKAEEEQAQSGKPLLVTLAEMGCLPPCDLSGLLNEQGKRVLKRSLAKLGAGTPFAVRAKPTLPLYVDAYGRGISFRQITLERLRDEPEALGNTSNPPTVDTVFVRRAGFSKRLLQFELQAAERRVLALVDGNAVARSIAHRTGLSAEEACAVLRRLEAIELLARRDPIGSPVERTTSARREVMVLDPDAEGFSKPLERLLAERPDPFHVVPIQGEQDVFAAIRRAKPSAVILNASAQGTDGCARTARSVREADELRDVVLVAVLELGSEADVQPLSEAGFDAVLAKPVSYADIERLLVA